jgi:hypothetical protein
VSVKGGAEAAYRRRTEAAGGAPRRVDGVPVARVSEGGEEAARKLLRVDVVLLVPLAGVKRLCIGGSTVYLPQSDLFFQFVRLSEGDMRSFGLTEIQEHIEVAPRTER